MTEWKTSVCVLQDAFCSHDEFPLRRAAASISVFPQELPPGARGQSAASCQPRNVTHTCTHARTHTRNPMFPAPLRLLTIYFVCHRGHVHAYKIREVRRPHPLSGCVHVCVFSLLSLGCNSLCVWVCYEVCNAAALRLLAAKQPWDLPHAAPGHAEEADYLVAASYSAQIKTKVTPANEPLRLSKWSRAPFSSPGVKTCSEKEGERKKRRKVQQRNSFCFNSELQFDGDQNILTVIVIILFFLLPVKSANRSHQSKIFLQTWAIELLRVLLK